MNSGQINFPKPIFLFSKNKLGDEKKIKFICWKKWPLWPQAEKELIIGGMQQVVQPHCLSV